MSDDESDIDVESADEDSGSEIEQPAMNKKKSSTAAAASALKRVDTIQLLNDDTEEIKKSKELYILELKTAQSESLRVLFETLKEILTEANIVFSPQGMKISAVDSSHVVFVNLDLKGANFEHYSCAEKINVGVNMLALHKLIKTVSKDDIITLFIERQNPNILSIKTESSRKNKVTIFELNLLDMSENTNMEFPADTDFDTVIELSSLDFQKICRDMSGIASAVEITSIAKQVIFTARGDVASSKTILTEDTDSVAMKTAEDDQIISNLFELRFLSFFTKATSLCPLVRLLMKGSFPLVVIYTVSSSGSLNFMLSPKVSSDEL